jgi:hypothetical protein
MLCDKSNNFVVTSVSEVTTKVLDLPKDPPPSRPTLPFLGPQTKDGGVGFFFSMLLFNVSVTFLPIAFAFLKKK